MDAAQTLADVAAAYLLNAQARDEARDAVRPLPPQRAARPADRAAEPAAAAAAARARRASAPSVRTPTPRSCSPTSTGSSRSTTPTATRSATSCCSRSRGGSPAWSGRATRWPGSPATSSCSSARTCSSADDVEVLARRIDQAFAGPFVLSDIELTITASVGDGVRRARARTSPTSSSYKADTAMYQAKRKGGAGHQIIDLREASQSRRAQQPRDGPAGGVRARTSSTSPTSRSCAARTGCVTGRRGAAALDASRTRPGPGHRRWSAIAEQTGLISEIGAWVLERSCRDRGRWLREHPDAPLDLAVNVSARQLIEPGLLRAPSRSVLERTGMDPTALILEMTENIFIEDSERAMSVLAELKRARHPARARRLRHRLLVAQLPAPAARSTSSRSTRASSPTSATAPTGGAIVAAVTNLAHVLGLTVTAEGVETAAPARRGQRHRLRVRAGLLLRATDARSRDRGPPPSRSDNSTASPRTA